MVGFKTKRKKPFRSGKRRRLERVQRILKWVNMFGTKRKQKRSKPSSIARRRRLSTMSTRQGGAGVGTHAATRKATRR